MEPILACLFDMKTIRDIPTPDEPWVVKNLLPSAAVSLLVSTPKIGKSTLLRHLSACVARGEPFLGYETTQSPVLYVDMEEIQYRAKEQFLALGLADTDPLHILVPGRLEQAHHHLRSLVRQKGPYGLIVVDTLFDLCPVDDVNSYSKTKAALAVVESLARESKAHIICAHHANKGFGSGSSRVLGSTAIFGMVSSLLSLSGGGESLYISTQLRHSQSLPKTKLIRQGTKFNLGQAVDNSAEKIKNRIEETLLSQKDPMTIDDVVAKAKTSKKSAIAGLADLESEGIVIRSGSGKPKDRYLFALSPGRRATHDNIKNIFSVSKN